MGATILPAVALERLIIGMYWGNLSTVRHFDAVRMAYDLSHTYHSLLTIREEDVAAIYRHQEKTNSLEWVRCTQELQAQSPEVLRVLEDIKDLPSHIKARMGRHSDKKKGVLPPQPHNGKQPKVFSRDYINVKGKDQKANLPEVDSEEQKALPSGLLWYE